MNKIILSIIILNWNTKKLLENLLSSICQNQPKFPFEVIVVDNGSTDGSSQMVKKNFSQFKILENKKNLGYACGNNRAAKKVRGEYLLFLNSDTKVLKESLDKMVNFAQKDSKIGIVGPKLLLPNGKVQPYGIGYELTLSRIFLLKFAHLVGRLSNNCPILQKIASKLSLEFWSWDKAREVDWVSGAALLVRKKIFDQINGFDTRFFMYFEDQDFCLRTKRASYKIYALPSAKLVHLGGRSLALNKERKKYYFESQKYFYAKNYGFWSNLFLRMFLPLYQWFIFRREDLGDAKNLGKSQ